MQLEFQFPMRTDALNTQIKRLNSYDLAIDLKRKNV